MKIKEQILFYLKNDALYKILKECEYKLRKSDDFTYDGWNTTFKYLDIICFNENDYEILEKNKNKLKKQLKNKLNLGINDKGANYKLDININISTSDSMEKQITIKFHLQPIGQGSYADVFKYKDEDYDKEIVVKRAKEKLDKKNIERFKREFEVMKGLSSPYIVEVYKYDESKNQYTMEFLDYTLEKYLEKNNQTITMEKRFNIVNQIIRGFKFLNSKNILHRDISPRNILIKEYEHLIIVKIADFGLVKLENSFLTSDQTEFRGSLNDQKLTIEGFKHYEIRHELYALTRLIAIVLSGKLNLSNCKDEDIKVFLRKGTSSLEERFQNLEELEEAIKGLKIKLI